MMSIKIKKAGEKNMGKINTHTVYKNDGLDHTHHIPEGGESLGMTMKANGFHAHLYEHDGRMVETSMGPTGVDHVHDTLEGHTSGPISMKSKLEEIKAEMAKAPESEDQLGISGGVKKNSRKK